MGYTHYWTIKGPIIVGNKEDMIANMEKVIINYIDILDYHVVNKKRCAFNGKYDDSHEDFILSFQKCEFDFCKTARKPYDQAVCEILLIAKYHYGKNMDLSSDGFHGDPAHVLIPDESWPAAFDNVNKMGYIMSYDDIKK